MASRQVAEWISQLHQARMDLGGVSQEHLAQCLGVETDTVRSWEAGRRIPPLLLLVRFGRELGLRLVVVDRDGRACAPEIETRGGESWEQMQVRGVMAALRSERKRCGISQEAMAARFGMTAWSITQFERGRRWPRPLVLAAWTSALGDTVQWRLMR